MTLQLRIGGWRVGRRLMVCEKKRLYAEADDVSTATIEA